MTIRPIKNTSDHESALKRIEALMLAKKDTDDGDELDVLVTLVDAYEAKHFPIEPADPIDAILFRMDQMDMDRKECRRKRRIERMYLIKTDGYQMKESILPQEYIVTVMDLILFE